MPMMLAKSILFLGQPRVLVCDGRCNKAWGIDGRPKHHFSKDVDDYVFLGDALLGTAPGPGATVTIEEGGDPKPSDVWLDEKDAPRMNRWCARQCERSRLIAVTLPDMNSPGPNLLKRQKPVSGQGGPRV